MIIKGFKVLLDPGLFSEFRFLSNNGIGVVLGKAKESGEWKPQSIQDPSVSPEEVLFNGEELTEWTSSDGECPDLTSFLAPPAGDPPAPAGTPSPVQDAPLTLETLPGDVSGTVMVESIREAEGSSGRKWEVVVISPGLSKNGNYYPEEVLKEAIPKFEGARAYAYEFRDGRLDHLPDGIPNKGLLRNLVGWFDGVKYEAGKGIVATLNLLESADWIRKVLPEAVSNRLLGLSIDADGKFSSRQVGNRVVRWVENLLGIRSVDIVSHPAAGGRFERLLASINPMKQEVFGMNGLLERLKKAFPGVSFVDGEGRILESVVLEKVEEILGKANSADEVKTLRDDLKSLRESIETGKSDAVVREKVSASKLPEVAQKSLLSQFIGKVVESKVVDDAIESMRTVVAAVQGDGTPPPGSGRTVEMVAERQEKLQAGLDKAFGLEVDAKFSGVPRFTSIRRAYNEYTRGLDPNVDGRISESDLRRLTEAFDSAQFSYALGNTLHRRLVKDYAAVDYGERLVAAVISANDFKTREAVRLGYFGDIPAVNPESADYAELTAFADEEATYAVGQKGGIVTVSRKAIINDDLGALQKIPTRLGRAARRTYATFVWTFAIGNGNIYDGQAWFRAGNNNLGAAALDGTTLKAAAMAIQKQTEPGSGKRLGLRPKTLAVPVELQFTAKQLVDSPVEPTANLGHALNPTAGLATVFVNPLFTDANDWYLFADPADVDIIEVAFLNGQENPEMFLADTPTVGQMFVADKLQYKIRHEYGGAVVDFRGGYKAVVT